MMIYKHKVQYYETDAMKIVHHSNYVRWMEETRVAFLEEIGVPLEMLEEMGIVCPVLSVNCEYQHMTVFGDTVTIDASLDEFSGVKMFVSYKMTLPDGRICCEAKSKHCFLKDGKILNLRKKYPELYEKFLPAIGSGAASD